MWIEAGFLSYFRNDPACLLRWFWDEAGLSLDWAPLGVWLIKRLKH
jgi:hypothetical protein